MLTTSQDVRAQLSALKQLGVTDEHLHTDRGRTGRNRERPGLTAALGAVRDGDVLVVTKLDRLGRSARDLSCGVKRNHKQVPFSCNTRAFSRYDALNTHQHRWIEVKR